MNYIIYIKDMSNLEADLGHQQNKTTLGSTVRQEQKSKAAVGTDFNWSGNMIRKNKAWTDEF